MRLDHMKLHQMNLANKVKIAKMAKDVKMIGGVDVAVVKETLVGCIGVFSYPELELVEYTCDVAPAKMSYVPGYLSFREIPVLLKCYRKLKHQPDLILVDGQGIAHPRALGIASHLGLLIKKPTIGCAKSHLFGDYQSPAKSRGSTTPIISGEKKIGIVLRTRDRINPLFISPGHLVDFDDCIEYVLSATTRFRLPEPIRFAHRVAGEKARRMNV